MSLSNFRAHLTRRSGNEKTGAIAVTTNSQNTCSLSCSFHPDNGGGCYAWSGYHLRNHWQKVSTGDRGKPWREHLADLAALPAGEKLRLCQAGDFPSTGQNISERYVRALAKAVRHLKAWSYTHHPLTPSNLKLLRFLNRQGVTINASTETEAAADAAVAAGLPAVLAVDSEESRAQWSTAAGNRVIVCPAQRRDGGVTCSDCMLCHSSGRGRRVIVAFLAHGTGRKRAQAAIAAATGGAQ